MGIPAYKLLFVDKDGQSSRVVCDYLAANGFEVEYANTGELAIEKIKLFKPRFVVCDLMLPDMNAMEILDYIAKDPHLSKRGMKILISSSHNNPANVKQCIQKGACDYLIKPIKPEILLPRLIFQEQKRREVVEEDSVSAQSLQGGELYMHLLSLVLKESVAPKNDHEILFNMTKMLAMTLKAVRCSVIECLDDRQTGFVQVSHDDIKLTNFKVNLEKYPEVLDVMSREQIVVIENIDSDPVLAEVKKNFKNISFNALIVCPVYKRGYFYGVMSARLDNKSKGFSENQIRFAMMMSQIVSLILSAQIPLPLELQRPAS